MGLNFLLPYNKEFCICTSKAARWLLAIAISTLPFQTPPAIHAQSENIPSSNPECEINISTKSAGAICVAKTLTITVGDSNQTIVNKRQAEARAKALASKKINSLILAVTDAVKLYPESGQCVPFARAVSGINISGAAISNKPNSNIPEDGAVLITTESRPGHAAVVTSINGNTIEVIERNYFSGWVSKRKILLNSPIIRGFIVHS
ncbi:MAG: CHAP domain-containing protein [Patescibacteria group bacterium]